MEQSISLVRWWCERLNHELHEDKGYVIIDPYLVGEDKLEVRFARRYLDIDEYLLDRNITYQIWEYSLKKRNELRTSQAWDAWKAINENGWDNPIGAAHDCAVGLGFCRPHRHRDC